jgi:hypothetical protein
MNPAYMMFAAEPWDGISWAVLTAMFDKSSTHIVLSNNAITKHKDTHIAHLQSLQRTDAKNENTATKKGSIPQGQTLRVIRMMNN